MEATPKWVQTTTAMSKEEINITIKEKEKVVKTGQVINKD